MYKSLAAHNNLKSNPSFAEPNAVGDMGEGDIGEAFDYTPQSDVESFVEEPSEFEQEESQKMDTSESQGQELHARKYDDATDDIPLGKLNLSNSSSGSVEQFSVPSETVCTESTPGTHEGSLNGNDIQVSGQESKNNKPLPPGTTGPVEGFQLVQATGLTDTSTPAPKGSSIPEFATPTPLMDFKLPTSKGSAPISSDSLPPTPAPAPPPTSYNPLMDESKSKQFTARTDYMIAEFFSRQVARLTRGAPEALDRSYRIFQQRFKERLGSQWAHITSQPEVEEAIKRVQDMYDYFESLEKIIRKQKLALEKMNDIELELSLWYRKEGISEPAGSIRDNMLHLSSSYQDICKERELLMSAYEQYAEFLKTFQKKAIGDALETMKKQRTSRLELDAYGSKLGQLEEKKLKTFARTPGPSESASLEKELGNVRAKFQDAKQKYQNYSTSLIDKAGLLDLKKGVDFAAHIEKIRQVHDSFNRGRAGVAEEVPEEDTIEMDEHGLPISK